MCIVQHVVEMVYTSVPSSKLHTWHPSVPYCGWVWSNTTSHTRKKFVVPEQIGATTFHESTHAEFFVIHFWNWFVVVLAPGTRSPSRWCNPPPALPFPLPQIMVKTTFMSSFHTNSLAFRLDFLKGKKNVLTSGGIVTTRGERRTDFFSKKIV